MTISPNQDRPSNFSTDMPSGSLQARGLGIGEMLDLIRAGAWQLAICVVVVVLAAGAYVFVAKPTFTADGLVQVEDDGKSGTKLKSTNLADILSGASAQADAEVQILSSRLVLDRVIGKMNLLISAEPRYFPLIGGAFARANAGAPSPVVAPFGLNKFAWGGEDISVKILDLPPSLNGMRLTLRAGNGDDYTVEDKDGVILLRGLRGQEHLEQTSSGPIRIFVDQLTARPGTEFYIAKLARQDVLASLAGGLDVIQQGKETGIIKLTYTDKTPENAAATINNIEQSYLEQNVDRRSAEAESSINFLGRQVPDLKKQVALAQAALNKYQLAHGSVDVTQETELFLKKSAELETQRVELIQQRDLALQRFTSQHPTVKALNEQIQSIALEQSQQKINATALPGTQQEVLGLMRDVDVSNQLYTATLNSLQQLEIQKAGTIGNVRIVDAALVPLKPATPRKQLILVLAMIVGLILGVAWLLLRHSMFTGIDDPWILEKSYGLATFASVPFSRLQQKLSKRLLKANAPELILAKTAPTSPTIEAIKSLRSALHFATIEARNKIVMLTGPSPGLGKSFITMNLGAVLAAGGAKVVVMDCDLRRGRLSLYAQIDVKARGLADVMLGQAALTDCIHQTSVEKLSLIPIGSSRVLNSADLLMGKAFDNLLEELAQKFDHVLIDTPPVLALTDASIIGRRCGTTLLILESGQSSLREVLETCRRLEQTGTRVSGVVFNKVSVKGNAYGYGPALDAYYDYT